MGIAGHGPTEREAQILDMSDAGVSADAIATELGLNVNYVRARIRDLSGNWGANVRFDAMVRKGSIALAKACARSGGRFA